MSGWWERNPIDVLIAHTISGWETVPYEWHVAMDEIVANAPKGLKITRMRFPEPVVDISRDKAAQVAIQNGAKWVWFVDTDIIWPPDTLSRLMRHNKPIVGGLYVRRHNPPFNEMLKFRTDGVAGLRPIQDGEYTPNSLVECDAIATGCMLVQTNIFEKMQPYQLTVDGQPARPAWFLWTEWRTPMGFCALPNQNIFGGSLIQNVAIGEEIYNGYGEPTIVSNTFTKHYTGDTVTITPRGMRLPIRITPEHNILAFRGLRRKSIWSGGRIRYHGRYWDFNAAKEVWVRADELTKNDWVGFPVIQEGNQKTLHLHDGIKKTRLLTDIEITPNLAYLMGLYFAEGSVGTSIQLAFNLNEKELANKAKELFESVFGINARVFEGDHARIVGASCHPLTRLLHSWFGTNARNKVVPDWIINSPKPIWLAFLKGTYDGDGYTTYNGPTRKRTIGWNIATEEGAIGLFALLIGLGIRPTLRRYIQPEKAFGHGNPIYVIKVLTDYNKLALLFGEPEDKRVAEVEKSIIHGGHLWMKVSNLAREHYDGQVYDLTVTNRNSYVLGGITVHNSEDFSFCAKARQSGIPVYCDTSIQGKHCGPIKFLPSGNNQLNLEFMG